MLCSPAMLNAVVLRFSIQAPPSYPTSGGAYLWQNCFCALVMA